jgi:LuxR family maltose regulon positive regulatory protein
MSAPLLATKLYIPPPRAQVVVRPRLRARLDETLDRKLTLVSAPAGFGKTTLVSQWVHQNYKGEEIKNKQARTIHPSNVAWLSLDEGDSSPPRFLAYLVAALQTIAPQLGSGILVALQSPQPPPPEAVLTVLLNEIAAIPDDFILVLDDYHLIDAPEIDAALAFLVEHLPPQMHLIIATRQDPQLPLSQLRARDELTELRAADLRFTFSEASEFLNRVMGLNLSAQEIEQLETRTEGWVVGLQLAALSMRGQSDTENFIQSFTGSHRFVLDYLMEQVLRQQPQAIQNFLLRTSILERLCGPLCDAVLNVRDGTGQETLAHLEHANLFLFPLDNERHWYRYHHLFVELLRQRLYQRFSDAPTETNLAELHQRASEWHEKNNMLIEAFHHATAANDIDRAERLLESGRILFHFPGTLNVLLAWLNSLPKPALDARPALWWYSAALSLILGITSGVQEKIDAAQVGLQDAPLTDKTRNLIGRIATARATLALTRYDLPTILAQSQRALEYLDENNLSDRTSAYWTRSVAHFLQGERAAARDAVNHALALAKASGRNFSLLLATTTTGTLQEVENELGAAVETYERALALAGEPALSFASDAHLGLARIQYEWNDLEAAEFHGAKSLELARQYDRVIDRYLLSEMFLARLKLAQGDVAGASAILTRSEQDARAKNFALRMPELAAGRVPILLAQGDVAAAAQLAQTYNLPMSQARVLLAKGDANAALAVLEPLREFVTAKNWADERLKVMVLQIVALALNQERDSSIALLGDALALAGPGGFIRLFVDEGEAMRLLISDFRSRNQDHAHRAYAEKLLTAFPKQPQSKIENRNSEMLEPLSERELEILRLLAQGYSNQEICERLFLALSTVKGHNRIIFDKLQVKSRTEAVARARALGLL